MKLMTPKFRVSYPAVLKPKFNKMNNKEEYSVVALFDKGADLSALKAACDEAIKKKWGNKIPANIRLPFRDQAERAYEQDGKKLLPNGYTAGAMFINLKSTQKPGVVDQQTNDIISESDFYAGCYARATVTVYAYEQLGNKGVAFGLQNIQKVAEGDSLLGKAKAQDDFAPVDSTTSEGSTATSLFN